MFQNELIFPVSCLSWRLDGTYPFKIFAHITKNIFETLI